MKKILLTIVILFLALCFTPPAKAQTPDPFSDIQYDQAWGCILAPRQKMSAPVTAEDNPRKIIKAPMKISGNCTGQTCDPIICLLPAGDRMRINKKNKGPNDGTGTGEKGVTCSEGRGVPLTDENLADGNNACTKYCYKNGETHFSEDFRRFMANAAAAQAGPNVEPKQMSEAQVAEAVPKLQFDDPAQGYPKEKTTFDPGEFTDIQINLYRAHGHVAYLLFTAPNGETTPTSVITENTGPTPFNGDANSLQQTELAFTNQTATTASDSASRECTLITWDPYGKVFDAKSLEPLGENDATVTLLDKDGVKLTLLTQDDPINVFGVYNILVMQDGYYELSVNPLTAHRFERVTLDTRYKNLYEPFIYLPGDPAFYEQKSLPKRVDLPLVPIGTPYTRPIAIALKSQTEMDEGMQFIIKATHPLSLVAFKVNGTTLISDGYNRILPPTTTKDGIWQAVIKKSLLSQSGYAIEVSKNPLYFGPGSATVEFNPLLSYIEGYALDKGQKVIPNALINVRLRSDNTLFSQIDADTNGFFSIPSKKLPFIEYYLEYVDPITKTKTLKSTAEFVANNEKYSKMKGVDYMTYVATIKKKISKQYETFRPSVQQKNPINKSSLPNLSFWIPILEGAIGIFSLVGIGIFLFIIRKKKEEGTTIN